MKEKFEKESDLMKKILFISYLMLSLLLFPFQKDAQAELTSFSVGANEKMSHTFYKGLVVFDDQSFFLHLDKKGEKEKVRVESFLILSPESLQSLPDFGKMKKEEVFAVKILQEFYLPKQEYRLVRMIFFDGAGNQLLEKSFDEERWLPLNPKKEKDQNSYFLKLSHEIGKAIENKEENNFLRY